MYISRNPKQWNAFLEMLRTSVAEGREEDLLTLLLTPDERDVLGLRMQIVYQLLAKRAPQREILQNLNTSAATITRGSNMLKTMPYEFVNWIREELIKQGPSEDRE